jgi:site-specific DNA recombinase
MTSAVSTSRPSAVSRGYTRQPPSEPIAEATQRAVIYLRVSTEEQARKDTDSEGYSLPAQREACWRKAADLGAEVVDEYVDRQTAKSDQRPALQLMLARIRDMADVDFVIVHKLDRLARNRRDDANLTVEIYQHGAKLVSVSEQIDDTPSGKLIHGIMATINEWYSANLGTESIKGMVEKAKKGGTPSRAPIGYCNVGQLVDGGEIRTVAIDEERAPHVVWAFKTFARGEHSLADLTEELDRRGLRTMPIGKKPAVSMHKSRVATMLRNRYYVGFVTFKGVEYQGRHEPLIDMQTFERVQAILDDRNLMSERRRLHDHYLRGSLFCAACGSRYVFSRNKGKGGTYDYFFCVGRRQGCGQPHLQTDVVEDAVVDYYKRFVGLPAALADELRAAVESQINDAQLDLERQAKRQERRRQKLERERKRLLDAYLGGAIELEQLKPEQERINQEIAAADRAIAAKDTRWHDVKKTFDDVLYLAQHCGRAYERADGETRRLLNRTFFEKLFIDGREVVGAQVTEPFRAVYGLDDPDGDEADETNPNPSQALLGPGSNKLRVVPLAARYSNSRSCSNRLRLAPPAGFEPATHGLGNRRSIP